MYSGFVTPTLTLTPSLSQATYKPGHIKKVGGKGYQKKFYATAALLHRELSVPMAVG